ncbi:CHST11 [Mytilus edulis]|uniref:Carbohydrate sulfotransferase n=1 Tax=Mytilus edulis TaxID=6550 RepID=A0A8S3UY87_MYTED|nr:CHST11 [Mytilus edulis]
MKKNLIGIAIACFIVCSFILYRNEFQGKPILLLPNGSNAATLLDENLDDEQYNSTLKERINHLKQFCKYHPNLYPNRKLVHQPLIDEILRVKYCWIEKVGSSFMKSFFRHFQNYTLARNTTLNRQTKHGSTDKDINQQQHKGDNYTRIMIVRDPFERLLSGYIDKFFLPSPIFWKKRGRYIIKHFRPNSSVKEQSCGHNVTFLEFIQYVVHVSTREKNMEEPHFTPMHTHCKPCLIHYDYVWKNGNDNAGFQTCYKTSYKYERTPYRWFRFPNGQRTFIFGCYL